ncbi:MAG: hypothetical protein ACUZ8N_01780 [Candidatus Scalindua sp.]
MIKLIIEHTIHLRGAGKATRLTSQFRQEAIPLQFMEEGKQKKGKNHNDSYPFSCNIYLSGLFCWFNLVD